EPVGEARPRWARRRGEVGGKTAIPFKTPQGSPDSFSGMDAIEQQQALAECGLGGGDSARYWREARYGNLELLEARFVSHRYAPHTHDTYALGAILAGCETYLLRGERRYARSGDLCFVHPGEVHDGEPHGAGYSYRMSYPTVALLQEVAADVTGRPV